MKKAAFKILLLFQLSILCTAQVELTPMPDLSCVCPGTQVTYTCTIGNTTSLVWIVNSHSKMFVINSSLDEELQVGGFIAVLTNRILDRNNIQFARFESTLTGNATSDVNVTCSAPAGSETVRLQVLAPEECSKGEDMKIIHIGILIPVGVIIATLF